MRRPQPRPVFVDDSGRRRRVARLAGVSLGGLAFAYLVVVGATFAGVPGLGRLDTPGLGQLTRPAGDRADVGDEPVEQAVPAEVAGPVGGAGADVPTGDADVSTTTTEATPAAPTDPPVATTTVSTTVPATATTVPGRGTSTPSSTVPAKGGGPPTSRPDPK